MVISKKKSPSRSASSNSFQNSRRKADQVGEMKLGRRRAKKLQL